MRTTPQHNPFQVAGPGFHALCLIIVLLALGNDSGLAASQPFPVTNGLVLWLSADKGVATVGKTNVTAWTDQSGAHNTLTLVGNPELARGAVNGQPAVVFRNGAYAMLETPIQAMSWIGVYKFDVNNASDRGVAMLGAWDQFAGFNGYHSYKFVASDAYVDGTLTDKPTPMMTGTFHLNDWRCTLDDQRGRVMFNAIAAEFPSHSNGTICNGELAEVAVFDRKVTVAEMNKLRAYFAEKYGYQLPHPIMTLKPGRRQAISGFGASMLMDGPGQNFNALSPDQRATAAKIMWGDGKLNTVRLWAFFAKERPADGRPSIAKFEEAYVTNGLIRDAIKNGVTNLLLSPGGPPAWCVNPANGQLETDQQAVDYAELIASYIDQLRTKDGIHITITGIANECPAITFSEWPVIIKTLRAKLDGRGLKNVKITAPEWANNDDYMGRVVNAIVNDSAASAALFAISSHSYAIPVGFGEYEGWCQGQGREFWEDESGTDGSNSQAVQGAELAGHLFNDLNFGVSNWVFFIGAHAAHSEDGLRLLLIEPLAGKNWLTVTQKFYYFQQASQAFDTGAVMRLAESSIGPNAYFARFNPRLTATGGRNPDGTWAVAVLNSSGGAYDGGNARRAETYSVDVVIPELATVPSLNMTVHRSGPGMDNVRQPDVMMKNGRVTIPIASTELVTLRATTSTTEAVEPPVFELPGGTYVSNASLAISCPTSGAGIYYTTDGLIPTERSQVYSAPIALPANARTKVQAIATKIGMASSGVVSASYNTGNLLYADSFPGDTINPAWYLELGFWRVRHGVLQQYNTLASSPKWAALRDSGINLPRDILLTTKIRIDSWGDGGPNACAGIGLSADRWGHGYNLFFCKDKQTIQLNDVNKDGVTPGPSINHPWIVGAWYWMKLQNLGGVLTAKIWADRSPEPRDWMLTWKHSSEHEGFPSLTGGAEAGIAVSFADLTVTAPGDIGAAATPTFDPPPATYNSPQKVKILTTTPGIGVHYTLDGSEPTAASPQIWPDNTLLIGDKRVVLKAKAICPGLCDSPTATANYTILQTVSVPVFSPAAGNYSGLQTISLSTPTPKAVIHYTLDGTAPTEKSPVYAGPIPIKTSTSFKAKAFAPGMNDSLEASADYELVQFGQTLFSDSFDASTLGSAWTTTKGAGTWQVENGVLKATDVAGVWDTNKAVVSNSGVKFPADVSITARLRVDQWTLEGDTSRAGVVLNTDLDGGKGRCLIFSSYPNHNSATLALLDERVAWGPVASFPWKTGTWYRLRLISYKGKLHGRIWPDGTPEPADWMLTWEHAAHDGFPALNGGYAAGEDLSFDDVKVEEVVPQKEP